jgi:hypothetical protein
MINQRRKMSEQHDVKPDVSRPIVEWMRQNNLPDDVADDAVICVDPTCREIQVEVWMRDPDGAIMLHGNGHMFTEIRSFPLLVDPAPGLIAAYDRLRAGLREERSAAAALKRQMLEEIIDELRVAGHSDAASWLASRQLAANPAPARQLVRFRVEAARVGPRADGGPCLRPGSAVTVRDHANLYLPDGAIVGYLDWCEWDDGVLWLSGRAIPRVVEQFGERSRYPSMDMLDLEYADETRTAISKMVIGGAMVEKIASYPLPPKGDAHVGE